MLQIQEAIAQLKCITFKLRVEKKDGKLVWGTGFFISCDGYALTASHLLEDYAKIDAHYKGQWISLEFLSDKSLPENDGDIALLRWPQPSVDLLDWLATSYLDPALPKRERIKFWAGRPVCAFGFPCEQYGQAEHFLDGNIDATQPLLEVDRRDYQGTGPNIIGGTEWLRFYAGDRARRLEGISGAPILDRETGWVIAVEHRYIPERNVVYATEIGRLATTWQDLASYAKPLKVNLTLFPFNGHSLDGWVGQPIACWQVVDEQILGIGSDPFAFPEAPAEDLKACSLLIWKGPRFHDGSARARVWLPTLYQKPGAAGLVLRYVNERTAILGLLRHSPVDGGGSLGLWKRSGMCLEEIKSCPLPLNAGYDGWYDLSLEIRDQQASIRAGQSDPLWAILPTHLLEGYFGLLKFSGTVVRFSNLRLEASTSE